MSYIHCFQNCILSGVKVLSGTFNGTGPGDCEGTMSVVKLSENAETMCDILLDVIYQAL